MSSDLALGELEAEVLGTLHKLGKASARDVMEEINKQKQLAYTTVSTVLDRLYHKHMVRRFKVVGRGGIKYLYSSAAPQDMRTSMVNRALGKLVSAFGPSIVPTIYDSLEQLSQEELSDLKGKIHKAQKK
ncbi:MAG TPA: BlaI/MecI/CopY family transcriptional regulator [Candidatus Saccharimonadales bacterium]|nr:BlaI/MecI/CopY family transcriptional regulator [Candidatus Saccharimonadales bacterium]